MCTLLSFRPTLLVVGVALVTPLEPGHAQTVRDSAGVQIVENARATLPAARAWRIDPTPMVTIGANAADADTLNELNLVMGIRRLSDGRYAVGVQGSHAVRFYDANGKYVSSAGRRGQGPGEFRQVMGVWRTRGDTLVVLDNGELEIFTGAGKFVAQGASRALGDRFVYPEDVMPDGSYLGVMFNERTIPPAGRARQSRPLVRVSRDGERVDTVGSFMSAEEVFDGRNWWGEGVGFSGHSHLAGSENAFFTSSPVSGEITQRNFQGRVIRLIRLPDRGRKVGNEEIRDYREWRLTSPGENGRPMSPAMKARAEQALERTVYADKMPTFGKLLVDRSGNLWAQRFDHRSVFFTPGPVRTQTMTVASRWDVIDANGRWMTTVDLPARFMPVEIGADYIAGLGRDQDDIEQVRVYRLRKPDSQ